MFDLHPKGFAVDGLQVKKCHNLVGVERVALALALGNVKDFLTKLVVNARVVREELQNAHERVVVASMPARFIALRRCLIHESTLCTRRRRTHKICAVSSLFESLSSFDASTFS